MFCVGVFLLLSNWVIVSRLPRERVGAEEPWDLFEGPNSLGEVDLWNPEGFTPRGKLLLRWWLLTIIGWIGAWLIALFAYVLRDA